MRVTFLAKRIWSWYIRLFHIRSIPCRITPAHDTTLSPTGFLATGPDTQLKITTTAPLVSGWHKLTYDADHTSCDVLFVPKIYPGFLLDDVPTETENNLFRVFPVGSVIHLHAHLPGSATHFFHYDFDPEGFRFDPFELDYPRTQIPYLDEFRLHRFELTYYGKAPFLVLCACISLRKIGSCRQFQRIRTAVGLFKRKGGETLIRWLAHKAYMSLQPPFSPTLWYENWSKRSTTEGENNVESSLGVASTPSFTALIFADESRPEKLNVTVESALTQNYKINELIIVTAGKTSAETRKQSNLLARTHRAVQYVLCEHQNFEEALNLVTSDVICLAQSGDHILPQATESLAKAMIEADADIAYGDEIVMEDAGCRVHKIVLRPGFCMDHFLNHPFTGMMTAVRRNLLGRTSSFSQCESNEAVNEQLILEALHRAKRIVHVPQILLERPKPPASPNSRRLPASSILEFLKSLGFPQVTVEPTTTPELYSIRYRQGPAGKTGVVIPTKNNGDLLKLAVQSLEETVAENLYDLVIVDHESDDPATLKLLDTIASRHRVIPYEGAFNFSRMNNVAVRFFNEEVDSFLFLNNDIQAIETGWLETMRDLLSRKDVGIVGATLLYPPKDPAVSDPNFTSQASGAVLNDTCLIQHAGVMVNVGLAEHYQKREFFRDAYQQGASQNPAVPHLVTRTFSAVTAACMLARRDVFETLGGFDDALAVGYQDVDLCLRARSLGYKTLCSAEAILFHHESVTRGLPDPDRTPPRPAHLDLTSIDEKDPHPEDTMTFSKRYHDLIGKDPFYPPMLSRSTAFYRPLRVPARSHDFDNQVISFEMPGPH